MILPLIVITSTFFFPIGMYLSGKIGSKLVIVIGGTVAVSCVLMSSFALSTGAFFVLYAVGFGIGKGFLYPAPLNAGWSHLPGRKGFVSGLIVSGLGIGSLLFGILAQKIVNPNNISPSMVTVADGIEEPYFPDSVNERVPLML